MASPLTVLRDWERRTRVVDPEVRDALTRRWEELPDHVRTPGQLLGRRSGGCEGTHGVFPRCNFACQPCYHSADANQVRVDAAHTLAEVDRQLGYLRRVRGPGQYAQLIGGEVSLLEPEDHAAVLEVMRRHDRVPMSFTHGDFDYDYLLRLALRPDGTPRFKHLSFAAHFDTTMTGRKGAVRVEREDELDPFRARFCDMFRRLEHDHGISSALAHNMTVTPANVGQVADVVRDCRSMGFRMFSFQPAALVGDERRWRDDFRDITDDEVWSQVESGVGTALPYKALQFGDLRCNRVTWGVYAGDAYVPVFDEDDPSDLDARDRFLAAFPGNFHFDGRAVMAARILRSTARHPASVPAAVGWARRFAGRAGGIGSLRGATPMTYVMHSFMDAADVAVAWDLMKRGEKADEPRVRAAQERLGACAYAMAHPETGELVPACVQHSLLDGAENAQLVTLLPRKPPETRRSLVRAQVPNPR